MRDVKTGFMTPTVDINDQSAVRNFYHAVGNSEGVLYSFSQDFSLYKIGEMDSDSGLITPVVPPTYLAAGSDAVAALSPKGVSERV
ncbi:nonstructural protein [Sigmofec virus UA08Rod_5764]|uniref:Nonstructural protein n=1 Tax=Sigmofec virus UA08Rod_5764 TaxID=2929440 RepID=A0A976R7Y9_9VIRU|nr:nonstructural protein [Sigmofec virus UA08Rod_5764]